MNTSTLPPLLREYFPSYEEKPSVTLADVEVSSDNGEGKEEVHSVSTVEGEKKQKTSRALLAQKRQMEAEEKAFKEKEEKALHTLRMWNIVKNNERKRKQKLLKDKVSLQHQIIMKQDELHEALVEQQQKEEKEQMLKMSPRCKFEKHNLSAPGTVQKLYRKSKKNKSQKNKNKIVDEHLEENTFIEIFNEERPPIFLEKDAFSEEDLSEFLENTMEDADFHELCHQPLNIQLEKLFGEKADIYLNPAVKESPRKAPNQALAKKKGHHGATALWESLRDFSRQKLRNKDALILPDVKNAYACFTRECLRRHITPVKRNFVSEEETPVNMNIEESDLLKDVRYRRHRQELMYRIAHINKDKTRLLFHNTEPHYVDNMKTNDGLRRFYPQLSQNGGNGNQKLPSITMKDSQDRLHLLHVSSSYPNRQLHKTEERKIKKHQQFSGGNLVFLTEAKASCKGQFAKRLMTEDKSKECIEDFKQFDKFGEHSKTKHETTHNIRFCEPLSMDALINQDNHFRQNLTSIMPQTR